MAKASPLESMAQHEIHHRRSTSSEEFNDSLEAVHMFDGSATRDLRDDDRDMLRLGKKQEFKRSYNFISTLGFTSIYMATWEFVLVSLSSGFVNGGFGGLFWVFIGTVIAYSSIVASLAEMASMVPSSGGQYHWVSEFAPESWQKPASYAAGWMSSLAWLASLTSSTYVLTTLLESIISLLPSLSTFTLTLFQSTLLMLILLLVTLVFNTYLFHLLPKIETLSLFGHLLGFFLVILPLLYLSPKNSAKQVFWEVTNNGGWGSRGVSCGVSQVAVLFCCIGSDSVVHMSEEVANASQIVPRAMWYSYLLNIGMGFLTLTTMLFCIGDLPTATSTPKPYLHLFSSMGSPLLATFLMILVFVLIYLGNITGLATTSREIWAFSRDGGFPFSGWISHVNPQTSIPTNAITFTSLASTALTLINLLSPQLFTILISLTLLALLSTYALSISLLLRKRLLHQPLPPARWSLRRFGLPINLFAVLYCVWIFAWATLPVTVPVVSVEGVNWAPLVWVLVVMGAASVYWGVGRRWYTPPVVGGGSDAEYVELRGLD